MPRSLACSVQTFPHPADHQIDQDHAGIHMLALNTTGFTRAFIVYKYKAWKSCKNIFPKTFCTIQWFKYSGLSCIKATNPWLWPWFDNFNLSWNQLATRFAYFWNLLLAGYHLIVKYTHLSTIVIRASSSVAAITKASWTSAKKKSNLPYMLILYT